MAHNNVWLRNLARVGRIAEADFAHGRYRVDFDSPEGPQRSGWLHMVTSRAGGDVHTWHYDLNEQVLVIALDPHIMSGVIVGALFQAAHGPASSSGDIQRSVFSDGTSVEYNRASSTLTVNAVGDIVCNVGGNVQMQVDGSVVVVASGAVTVDSPEIKLNDGTGVVTGECVCHFTGNPHGDVSTVVFAGK